VNRPAGACVEQCPVCSRAAHIALGEKDGRPLWRCPHCGAIFAQPDTHASAELYEHYYDAAQFVTPHNVQVSLDRLAAGVRPFRMTGCWLDVGYGEGALLSTAERHGWKCYGVEVSPQALAHGRTRGWGVSSAFGDAEFRQDSFDVVTMIEFLEHIANPHAALKSAARCLRPGGLLYLTTPNADSFNRRMLGLSWSVIAPPEHLTLWTPHGLRLALVSAGFSVVRLRTEGYNPADLLVRLRATRGNQRPVNRNEVGRALSDVLGRSRTRRALKSAVNGVLNLLQLGDTLKAWATRDS
jgi:SAM-dependent methyltransferase